VLILTQNYTKVLVLGGREILEFERKELAEIKMTARFPVLKLSDILGLVWQLFEVFQSTCQTFDEDLSI
jgi:hypothetical protein